MKKIVSVGILGFNLALTGAIAKKTLNLIPNTKESDKNFYTRLKGGRK